MEQAAAPRQYSTINVKAAAALFDSKFGLNHNTGRWGAQPFPRLGRISYDTSSEMLAPKNHSYRVTRHHALRKPFMKGFIAKQS